MVSHWRARAAFTPYMKSEARAASQSRIGPTLQELIRIERVEHLHTYDVLAE